MSQDDFYTRVGHERIGSRQVDELIGLARGLCADGVLNQAEVEFLQRWLAINGSIIDQPLFYTLWDRISSILADGIVDEDEQRELFELLQSISGEPLELGEALKPSGFPLCEPPPRLQFEGWEYAFTGTFLFGKRADCESAVRAKGAIVGSVRKTTNVLVIGSYATESWKHSAMGLKILKACELRDAGQRIAIVSEQHWINELTGKV